MAMPKFLKRALSVVTAMAFIGSAEVYPYQDKLAPKSSFSTQEHTQGKSWPLAVVDIPVISLIPKDFRQQVDFLHALVLHPKPTMALYRLFLTRSGFLTSRVQEDLKGLEDIENKGALASMTEQDKLRKANSRLGKIVEYFVETLHGKTSWEQMDARLYHADPATQTPETMVGFLLSHLGWEIALVDGKARIKIKGDAKPKAAIPTAKSSARVFVMQDDSNAGDGAGLSRVTALIRSGPRLPSPSALQFSPYRRVALAEAVRKMMDENRYEEAADLLVAGTKEPDQVREVVRILRENLGPAYSALLFSKAHPELAAYLLIGMVAVGPKSAWRKDIFRWNEPQPQVDQDALGWACEVLRLVDEFTSPGIGRRGLKAPEIMLQMAVRGKEIPYGPAVAEAIMNQIWTMAKDEPEFDLADRAFIRLENYFGHEFQVLNEITLAKRTGRLYARPVPQEKRIDVGIPLTSDTQVVVYVKGLLEGMDANAIEMASQILLVKMEPLRAYRILKQIVISDPSLIHLLRAVLPEFVAQFFVEINDAATEEESRKDLWGNVSIFQWTMRELAQLHRSDELSPAVPVMRAMLTNDLVARGGRKLFQKILDPKTTQPHVSEGEPEPIACVLEMYDAIYQQDDRIVDWLTFYKTGKIFAADLSPEERQMQMTEWLEELFFLSHDRFAFSKGLEYLERLKRIADKEAIPHLLSIVNRRLQMLPEDLGETLEEYNHFNKVCLKTAYEIDPPTFARSYWTHAGNVPKPAQPLASKLKSFLPQLWRPSSVTPFTPPVWRHAEMDNLLLEILDGDEQTNMALYGVKEGAHDRLTDFVSDALTNAPASLDTRAVAAAAFMKSGLHLWRLKDLVKVQYPGLLGLYRARSVLKNMDLRFEAISYQTHKEPFQGEHLNVEMVLGTPRYEDILKRMAKIVERGVENWHNTLTGVVHKSGSFAGGDPTFTGIIVDYMREHEKQWQELFRGAQLGTKERADAVHAFFRVLEQGDEYTGQFPLLSEYVAFLNNPDPESVIQAARAVNDAMRQKPPEKTVQIKELVVVRNEIAVSPARVVIDLGERLEKAEVRIQGFASVLVITGMLGCFFNPPYAALLMRYLSTLPGVSQMLAVILQSNAHSNMLQFLGGVYVTILCMAVLGSLLFIMALGRGLVWYAWQRVKIIRELGENLGAMKDLLPSIEFDANKSLRDQLAELVPPILKALPPRAQAFLEIADAGGSDSIEQLIGILKEDLKDPWNETLLHYAEARSRLLQLEGHTTVPLIQAASFDYVTDETVFEIAL